MSAAEIFTAAWNDCQRDSPPAKFATGVKKIPYADLVAAVETEDFRFINNFVRSFHSGEVYVFTQAFDPEELTRFKNTAFAWGQKQPSQEPKLVDTVPDYRSRRDWHAEDHGPGYSSTYDMMHFYRWNDDPIRAFELFDPKYRILRVISGFDPEDIKNNKPEDGIVDRAEISHYPPGAGGIAFHCDPIQATRFFFTLNLNRFGVDYTAGGFGVGTGEGKVLRVDPMIDVGSLTGFMPTVCHGVEIIDPHLPTVWDKIAGRWYAAISMVTTHSIIDRSFTRPVSGYPTLRDQIKRATEDKNSAPVT